MHQRAFQVEGAVRQMNGASRIRPPRSTGRRTVFCTRTNGGPKHKSNINMKTNTPKQDGMKPFAEMADTALKNYEQAVRTGLKMQEEAGKWWSSMLSKTAGTQEWQKRFTELSGMANTMMPLAQRRMEEVMSLMEKNGRTNAELMKKAVDAAQTPGMAECQAKWLEFWSSSVGAVRSNTEALTQFTSKAIDGWLDFVRKNADATEAYAAKTA